MAEARPDDPALAVWEDEGGPLGSMPIGARSPARLSRRERAVRLDGDLTYLGLTWLKLVGEHVPPRDMDHAEGRRLWRSCLTSERFWFLVRMRTGLRQLLHVGKTSTGRR